MALPPLPGFPSLPPLTLGGAAGPSTAGQNQQGAGWSMGGGAWNVNLGGSGGPATQANMSPLSLPVLIAIGVAAWLLLKR